MEPENFPEPLNAWHVEGCVSGMTMAGGTTGRLQLPTLVVLNPLSPPSPRSRVHGLGLPTKRALGFKVSK